MVAEQNKDVIEQLSLLTGNIVALYIYDSNNYMDWLNKDILTRWKLKEIDFKTTYIDKAAIQLNSTDMFRID